VIVKEHNELAMSSIACRGKGRKREVSWDHLKRSFEEAATTVREVPQHISSPTGLMQ